MHRRFLGFITHPKGSYDIFYIFPTIKMRPAAWKIKETLWGRQSLKSLSVNKAVWAKNNPARAISDRIIAKLADGGP